ncbi:hypothetical protein J437_LFUL003118 [Ladona fulva]|uniref:BESS domain-containing protein n=1 Tax=Ladona fulva TaxID=123851 RepID=A0A8K0K0M1_LADFU|nr:hypothetical protein J437_LFUL003118 [Ladona fulva]
MKKWANVRDSFNKCEKRYKASLTSGSGRQPTSRYVYGQQLQFLKKTTEGRPTEDTMSVGNEDPSEADGDDDLRTKESDDFKIPIKNVKKRKLDAIELELIKIFQKQPDRHMSFFKAVLHKKKLFSTGNCVVLSIPINVWQSGRMSY